MLACEPASFWRENVIAVVTLLRILARMSKWRKRATSSPEHFSLDLEAPPPKPGKSALGTRLGNKLSNVGSFIIFRSGEGVASSTKLTVLTFRVKNGKMKLSGVCIFSIYTKKRKVKFPLPLFLERLIERKCHGILVLVTFSAKRIKSRDPSHW